MTKTTISNFSQAAQQAQHWVNEVAGELDDGDPAKEGPFVMRLSLPAGYKVQPHQHSQTENATVIDGQFMVGMGDKFDAKAMKTLKAGGFGSIPAKTNHYAMAKTHVVLQIHGEGPFDLTYVNPADDPSKAASK